MISTGRLSVPVNASMYKYAFLSSLVFVIGQQIYWPQQQQYYHLAILFAYMAFGDLREHSRCDLGTDGALLIAVLAASVVSIVERYVVLDISLLYRLSLGVAGTVAVKAFLELRAIISERRAEYIAERHREILERSTLFPQALLIVTCLVIVVAIAYTFGNLIT